jgi:hypothetical protein
LGARGRAIRPMTWSVEGKRGRLLVSMQGTFGRRVGHRGGSGTGREVRLRWAIRESGCSVLVTHAGVGGRKVRR